LPNLQLTEFLEYDDVINLFAEQKLRLETI